MENIVFKIHSQGNYSVLAACDVEVLGKTFEDGKIFFHVKESFYFGEKISSEKLSELLDEFDNVNLIGENAVKVALEKNLAEEGSVLKIKGVPHLQIFRI